MSGFFSFIMSIIAIVVMRILSFHTKLNDYSLPIVDIESLVGGDKSKYKILAVDPHPDDETMISGGFLALASMKKNIEVRHVCMTKGEKGNELISPPINVLASMREKEYEGAIVTLGINDHKILDFPDGDLKEKYIELLRQLEKEIIAFSPDLILTYERGGLYGHPDHIALTQAVEELVKEKFPNIKILYKTLPLTMIKEIENNVEMHIEGNIEHSLPKFRMPVGKVFWKKYMAARKHKTQNLSHGKPLILVMLVLANEYFTD